MITFLTGMVILLAVAFVLLLCLCTGLAVADKARREQVQATLKALEAQSQWNASVEDELHKLRKELSATMGDVSNCYKGVRDFATNAQEQIKLLRERHEQLVTILRGSNRVPP